MLRSVHVMSILDQLNTHLNSRGLFYWEPNWFCPIAENTPLLIVASIRRIYLPLIRCMFGFSIHIPKVFTRAKRRSINGFL